MADHTALPANIWPTYYAYDHKIQRCDATTGHFVLNVAYCDTPERARELVHAANTLPAVADLVKALEAVLDSAQSISPEQTAALKLASSALSRFRELEKANG